jgi:hypothetical protein
VRPCRESPEIVPEEAPERNPARMAGSDGRLGCTAPMLVLLDLGMLLSRRFSHPSIVCLF